MGTGLRRYDKEDGTRQAFVTRDGKEAPPEADRFDVLAALIEAYERRRWPIGPPDATSAIRYCMEQRGFTHPTWRRCPVRSRARRKS